MSGLFGESCTLGQQKEVAGGCQQWYGEISDLCLEGEGENLQCLQGRGRLVEGYPWYAGIS